MAVVDIPAPMSGSVFEVLVSAGASVSAGQEVIVLESMKMEIPVESPEAGVVAAGGRVLGVTALGADVAAAQSRAYEAVGRIDWPEGFCRRDIGWRAV